MSALTIITVWEIFLSQSNKSTARRFVKCTQCLYLYSVHDACICTVYTLLVFFCFSCSLSKSRLAVCVEQECEYVSGTVNCIEVEVTDFAVDFEMLHYPPCCDLNTEGVRQAYSECEPVLCDTWAKV